MIITNNHNNNNNNDNNNDTDNDDNNNNNIVVIKTIKNIIQYININKKIAISIVMVRCYSCLGELMLIGGSLSIRVRGRAATWPDVIPEVASACPIRKSIIGALSNKK